MDTRQFRENLLVYGTDIQQWPKEIRKAGLEALKKSSELKALVADHDQFERILKTRKYEEPSSNLAQRIISASLRENAKAQLSTISFFSELLAVFSLPKPAITAVSVLIIVLLIGFAAGFMNPLETVFTDQEQTYIQEFLYYEGDIL
jgi:hypothetical protein